MKVNAQVTAVTTSLEAIYNIAFVMILSLGFGFVTQFYGSGTLIQFMLLYFVLLPYTFLMNTTNNKERVIEDGWQNVFKNMFPNCGSETPSAENEIDHVPQGDIHPPATSLFKESRTKRVKTAIQAMATPKPASSGSSNNDNDIQISTIFRNQQSNSTMNENINMVTLNVPIDQ